MDKDYAVAPDERGDLVLHRADCPDVRMMAAAGLPVMTMLGCEREPGADLKRHVCLDEA
jgi:hypothetical protein